MNMQKHVFGFALFILIFSVSVYFVTIMAAPLQMIPPVPIYESPARSVPLSQPASYRVQLVSLDFITQTSYTTLTFKRDRNTAAPAKLWVSVSFFVPELPGKRWSSVPVEVIDPLSDDRDEATLTLVSGFYGRGNASAAPRSGYYALVAVSTVSGDDAASRAEEAAADIRTAAPVLVQVEQRLSR
ncbi:MAG TPA: hypothetical protein VGC89_11745 [Pyrinomonadaceae bacterium]